MFTQLIEVGRKFSKANEGKLRKALESISELLSQLDVTEAERSHADKHRALQRAPARGRVQPTFLKFRTAVAPRFSLSTVRELYSRPALQTLVPPL